MRNILLAVGQSAVLFATAVECANREDVLLKGKLEKCGAFTRETFQVCAKPKPVGKVASE